MKLKTILSVAVLIATPHLALAQQGDPLVAATTADACNGKVPINAAWQDDGRLAVTCPSGSGAVAGAGLGATNFALPLLLTLVAGAVAAGGGSSTSGTN